MTFEENNLEKPVTIKPLENNCTNYHNNICDSKQQTGSAILDKLLNGGYEKSIITTIYGPSASGKTCFSILASIQTVKLGKKVVYIDTEGSFSIDRAIQLYPDFHKMIDYFLFFKPISFTQQKEVFEKLRTLLTNKSSDNIGLIVIDSIAMLYRLEVASASDYSNVNKEMSQQLAYLIEIARTKNIPVLLTNQVYANFENKNEVNMIGGDLVKYTSKCIIELKKAHKLRTVIIKRHRSLPEGIYTNFKIEETGIFQGFSNNTPN